MKVEKIHFVVLLLGTLVCFGCGAVAPEVGENGDVGESECHKLQLHCRLGEVCLQQREGGFYCGCKEEGKASCFGDEVCGTDIKNDIKNCGGCDKKCGGDGVKCENGMCVCYEEGKLVDLEMGRFVDGSGKAQSCGVCGYKCGKGIEGGEIACEGGLCADLSCDLGSDGRRKMRCGELCKDLLVDKENCGRCGQKCGDGGCKEGRCECEWGKMKCGPMCVDVQRDSQHCGGCGKSCGIAEICVRGECKCGIGGQCGDGERCVDGVCKCGNGGKCGDSERCVAGRCKCGFMVCGKGVKCKEGKCQCVNEGIVHITGENIAVCQEKGRCDEGPCGIGAVCRSEGSAQGVCRCVNDYSAWGDVCEVGQCGDDRRCVCKGGQVLYKVERGDFIKIGCVSSCVSGQRGSDVIKCDDGKVCVKVGGHSRGGECKACKDFGKEKCGLECADIQSDREHCGGCGKKCGDGQVCVNGECKGCEDAGKVKCGTVCVDTQSDREHCGGCGQKCGDNEVCEKGVCQGCGSGEKFCDSKCVNIQTDGEHCGGCGKKCGENQVCEGGKCGCVAQTTRCGLVCVYVQSDSEHCGGCGLKCSYAEKCVDGSCKECEGDTRYCDSKCVNIQTDGEHCGECFKKCEGSCEDGKCV